MLNFFKPTFKMLCCRQTWASLALLSIFATHATATTGTKPGTACNPDFDVDRCIGASIGLCFYGIWIITPCGGNRVCKGDPGSVWCQSPGGAPPVIVPTSGGSSFPGQAGIHGNSGMVTTTKRNGETPTSTRTMSTNKATKKNEEKATTTKKNDDETTSTKKNENRTTTTSMTTTTRTDIKPTSTQKSEDAGKTKTKTLTSSSTKKDEDNKTSTTTTKKDEDKKTSTKTVTTTKTKTLGAKELGVGHEVNHVDSFKLNVGPASQAESSLIVERR
ncbi:hypothetical protein HDV05_008752 [Chytridiales sp. JEL 0842]|nr:hypothetical protein HDV05_008752 [Chytridiales sp. JEL 0842]